MNVNEDAEIIEEIEAIVLFLREKEWFIQETWVSGPTHASCGNYNIKASKSRPSGRRSHAALRIRGNIRIQAIITECELRVLLDTPFSSSSDYIFGEELADPQCLRRFGDLLDGLS